MRILDDESDKALNRITLFLTSAEAAELRDSVKLLLADDSHHHEHVSSADFKKELTLTVYDSQSLESFDDRSKRLITFDT